MTPPARRPILVWIICLTFFVLCSLRLIALAPAPYIVSSITKFDQHSNAVTRQRIIRSDDPYETVILMENQNRIDEITEAIVRIFPRDFAGYAFYIIGESLALAAAILLFQLRSCSFSLFLCTFAFRLTHIVYLCAGGQIHSGISESVLVFVIARLLLPIILILIYVRLLSKRGTLH